MTLRVLISAQMDSWIASHDKGRLFKSHEPTALEDVKELHVVFGGNSSVLIETVTAGVPAAYVDQVGPRFSRPPRTCRCGLDLSYWRGSGFR
jgi:hypothetical protein